MDEKTEKGIDFIRDFIPKVSRTFALTIGFLPKSLKNSVYCSYLLCRVADTLEDSPYIGSDEKKIRLLHLNVLLKEAARGISLRPDQISALYDSVDPEMGDDHRLLAESAELFEILESLPADHKKIIYFWAAEMAGGMAKYSQLKPAVDGSPAVLTDIQDWDKYCYYVAGTVGHMMTELFINNFKMDDSRSEKIKELSNSFGLALQKVNLIKDTPEDRDRGFCFLPLNIITKHRLTPLSLADSSNSPDITEFVNHLVDLTIGHLDDAIEYTTLIPRRYRGVRMFLAVPVLLAVETLALINKNPVVTMTGPPVKLNRQNVTRLVNFASMIILSNSALLGYYKRLRLKTGTTVQMKVL